MSEPDEPSGKMKKGLARWFLPLLIVAVFLSGLLILVDRSWSRAYYFRVIAHSLMGLVLCVLFMRKLLAELRPFWGKIRLFLSGFFFFVLFNLFLAPLTGMMIIIVQIIAMVLFHLYARRSFLKRAQGDAFPGWTDPRIAGYYLAGLTLMTGYILVPTCVNFLLSYHYFHGIFALLLLVWGALVFHPKILPSPSKTAMRSMETLRRLRIPVAVVLALASGFLYYRKNIYDIDETDPTQPEVFATYEVGAKPAHFKALDARHLTESESCSSVGCHDELYNQWRGSTHRFSTNNRFYLKVLKKYIDDKGVASARFCANCHDPVGVLSDDFEERYSSGLIDNPEGISCKVCHTITDFQSVRGNGIYSVRREIDFPDLFPGRPGGGMDLSMNVGLRLDARPHVKSYRRKSFYRSSRYCISCHLVIVDGSVGMDQDLRLHTLFSQWEKSTWAKKLNCVDCHMPLMQMDLNGYAFFDHRIMGVKENLLQLARYEEEDRRYIEDFQRYTRRYRRGDLVPGTFPIVYAEELYEFWRNPAKEINLLTLFPPDLMLRFKRARRFLSAGPTIDMELDMPERAIEEGWLEFIVHTTNVRAGHDFPAGPIDVNQIWLEVKLEDSQGRVLYHSGFLDPDGYLDPAAHKLGCDRLLDAEGRPILYHEFWRAAKVEGRRILMSGESTSDEFKIPFPDDAEGPFVLTIAWQSRQMNQRITDWVFDDGKVRLPVLTLNYREIHLDFGLGPYGERDVEIHEIVAPFLGQDRDTSGLTIRPWTYEQEETPEPQEGSSQLRRPGPLDAGALKTGDTTPISVSSDR